MISIWFGPSSNSLVRIEGPILIYYYIENFHQNHRGYEDDR